MALSQFLSRIPWFISPVKVPCHKCSSKGRRGPRSLLCQECQKALDESRLDPTLLFKGENEPPSIQLFYDLWFVAVLSACSSTHEIGNVSELATFLEFFTLMWFTWFGTILFDVRFAFDSWFIRLSKAWSLGIMALLAMTLVPFRPGENTFGHDLQKLGAVLMASRLFLALQYLVIMLAVWVRCPEKRLLWPFIATIATTSIAGIMFSATYREDTSHPTTSLAIWLAMSAAEAITLLYISSQWEVMGFSRTNLVERMGALTLIVMGEGIIGMTESISFILKTSPAVSSTTIGVSIAVMLTCYSIWILYFDHTDSDKPGKRITRSSPRRQIWAFLHFPLHVAILVTLKGSAALMLWWVAVEAITLGPLQNLYNLGLAPDFDDFDTLTGAKVYPMMQSTLQQIIKIYDGTISLTPDMNDILNSISDLGSFSNDTVLDHAYDLSAEVGDQILTTILTKLNLARSDDTGNTSSSTATEDHFEDKITEVFNEFETMWFVAFFVAAGCILIALAVLRFFGLEEGPIWPSWLRRGKIRPPKSLVGVGVHVLIGTALATLASMETSANSDYLYNYVFSPWLIPTVFLTYLLVITCDNILYGNFSNVHHPPIFREEEKDNHEYSQIQPEQVELYETPREKRPLVHERHSSASALLTPHLSPNERDGDDISLARTEDSRLHHDEENPEVRVDFGP